MAPFAAIPLGDAPPSLAGAQPARSRWQRHGRGCTALLLVAAVLGCTTVAQEPEVTRAWVQAASDGQWVARALTDAASCPSLRWRGGSAVMRTRSQPATIPARTGGAQAEVKPAEFAQRSCEVAVPAGASELQIGRVSLPPPPTQIERIVLVGDTGCRMKQSENAFHDCNDPARWPFAAIARSAASLKPDLVIHVGDLHYRESPCPPGRPGCAGSPWGYGLDTWEADFFRPAAPLVAAAPWLFVRGNHESCSRAGVGWHRLFDGRGWAQNLSCQDPQQDRDGDFTEPFALPISADTQLIVFDSSFASGRAYQAQDAVFKRYASQLARVEQLAAAKPHSIFLNHHPVLGFAGSQSGAPKPGNAGLMSVMQAAAPTRLYAQGIDLVLNGHVHLFEALGFASSHPSTVVLGNSGSAMEGFIAEAAALRSQPAPGAIVQSFATHSGFGFATLDRRPTGWSLTAWSVDGQVLKRCEIEGQRLHCGP